jgi:hypothetical protein
MLRQGHTAASIRIRSFSFIFEHLAGSRIDADFLRYFSGVVIEGIAQAGANRLPLKFLVSDLSRMRFQCYRSGLGDADFGVFRQFLAPCMLAQKMR